MTRAHADCRLAINQHFKGRISLRAERRMRQHLADCAECRANYERHLALAEIDPQAPSAKDRIAIGLGLSAGSRGPSWAPMIAAFGAGVATLALLVMGPAGGASREADPLKGPLASASAPSASLTSEFRERGAVPTRAESALIAYRMVDGKASEQVQSGVRRGDELAFAYTNDAGWDYLAVFGLDEHGHVYWYYPAWADPQDNPSSIRIMPGSELRELPDAVSHRLDGSRLRLFGIFSKTPLSVRQVEQRLELLKAGGRNLSMPGTFEWQRWLDVESR